MLKLAMRAVNDWGWNHENQLSKAVLIGAAVCGNGLSAQH